MIDRYSRPAMKRVWSDENKYQKWLDVELAVAEAWTAQGVIPVEDMKKLRDVKYNHARMMEIFETTRHDVTAFLASITENLGPEGRWLHYGLTSSDVMDTALSLQLCEASEVLDEDIGELIEVLKNLALEHKNALMMGRTHGVHAEPITFGLKMALWWSEMNRHDLRLTSAEAEIAVGKISGAVGTHATAPLEVEEFVCGQLRLAVDPVSNQIIQRDRHAHFVMTLALIAASLEKFATEIRTLQRTEIHEVEEPFSEGQTGSSSMPHKRNPELSERICGLARLIRGHSVTALENVALWGERDISHSSAERIILPDSCLALDYMLNLFTHIMKNLKVFHVRMWENMGASKGLVFSQRVLLALIEKGLERERAYQIVQRAAASVLEGPSYGYNGDLRDVLKKYPEVQKFLPAEKLDELCTYDYYTRHVNQIFARLGLA